MSFLPIIGMTWSKMLNFDKEFCLLTRFPAPPAHGVLLDIDSFVFKENAPQQDLLMWLTMFTCLSPTLSTIQLTAKEKWRQAVAFASELSLQSVRVLLFYHSSSLKFLSFAFFPGKIVFMCELFH